MLKFIFLLFSLTSFLYAAIIPIRHPFEAIAVELKGRIRLLQELGRHWSILTGEECFQVFHENLAELTNRIDSISINQHDTTKRLAQVVCDDDELFTTLVNQLILPDVHEELDINQVKNIFEQDEIVIEALSVRIDMVTCKPEYKAAKKSIKHYLKKYKDKVNKAKLMSLKNL